MYAVPMIATYIILMAVLANSFETGALTKVVDQAQTGWNGAQYGIEITDDPRRSSNFYRRV